jgi:hypothetical protein
LDVDDAWDTRKLELQEDALASAPQAVASFTRCSQKSDWLPCPNIRYPEPQLSEQEFWLALWNANFITPSSVVVRRETILGVGGFDESMRYCEDWECWFRILRSGQFIQVAEPLCYYRQHPNQMTKHTYKMVKFAWLARRRMIELHGDRLAAAGLPFGQQQQEAQRQYRGRVMLAFYQREMSAARRLFWDYLREFPFDVKMWKYALCSLLPRKVLISLRDQPGLAEAAANS